MSVSLKGQENILLRRPSVTRTPSSQDGLSELASDPVSRGINSPSGVPDGTLISQSHNPYAYVLLLLHKTVAGIVDSFPL